MTINTIRSNPDKYIAEIFAESCYSPHASLYGPGTLAQIKKWIKTTKIPVVLGYEIDAAQLPCVAINLQGSSPSQQYLGDTGFPGEHDVQSQERDILVPGFAPKNLVFTKDVSGAFLYATLTLPDAMPFDQTQLFLPGLLLRDADNREFRLDLDQDGNILIYSSPAGPTLAQINSTFLQVVSPMLQASFNGGAMLYEESVMLAIFGHSSRIEGLWLYNIVMWGILKFRPVLESTYNLMLSLPSASDFTKDDNYLGENVWRRFISLSTKTLWTWEGARQQDILGLVLSTHNGSSNPSNSST